jgi:hypothetical protein
MKQGKRRNPGKARESAEAYAKDHEFVLPPRGFSNAILDIYPGFDFRKWQESREWKLFNAGRAWAASEIASDSEIMSDAYRKLEKEGGLSRDLPPSKG